MEENSIGRKFKIAGIVFICFTILSGLLMFIDLIKISKGLENLFKYYLEYGGTLDYVYKFSLISFIGYGIGITLCLVGSYLNNNLDRKSKEFSSLKTVIEKSITENNSNKRDKNTEKPKTNQLSKEEQYVKENDPEFYEQIKKDYSYDKDLFYQYIKERYDLLKEIL